MSKSKIQDNYVSTLEKRFLKEMPRIRKEIRVYETHLKNGKLNSSPKIAPQYKH